MAGNSPLLRVSPKLEHAFGPATPTHSPSPSIRSSTSSRHPLQTLTLHEYRRLQNTPPPPTTASPGKTLRRKKATSTLNEPERTSASRTSTFRSRFSSGRLHLSQSAYQLAGHQPLPPSPPHALEETEFADHLYRSRSAEPRDPQDPEPGLSARADSLRSSTPKVGHWKPTKRLPKPSPSTAPLSPISPISPISPPAAALVPHLQTTHRTSTRSTEHVPSVDTYSTPTFSLSRFPQPPHLPGPPLSSPNEEDALPRLNISFTSIPPATPPATPAIIHYRGASFDLVNPHDSLLFHDIVTPSREIDSSEYLPLCSSESPPELAEVSQYLPLPHHKAD
jgi:hypothetical protein